MNIEHEVEDQEVLSIAAAPLRVSAMREAEKLTAGDRNADYGDPVANHQHIADIFNAITGHNISARDAAMLHVATKIARMKTTPTKLDSTVDAMAYIGIALECAVAENEAG